ncbi:hypothetical protein ACMFMG_001022 [Clarireedia jacksonii]
MTKAEYRTVLYLVLNQPSIHPSIHSSITSHRITHQSKMYAQQPKTTNHSNPKPKPKPVPNHAFVARSLTNQRRELSLPPLPSLGYVQPPRPGPQPQPQH